MARPKVHGQHTRLNGKTKEYIAWDRMKSRCSNPKNRSYRWYGAKGVTVCEQWLKSFSEFFKHVGKSPTEKHSLDRINTFGNYEPGNVKWSTYLEQNNNKRLTKIKINGNL